MHRAKDTYCITLHAINVVDHVHAYLDAYIYAHTDTNLWTGSCAVQLHLVAHASFATNAIRGQRWADQDPRKGRSRNNQGLHGLEVLRRLLSVL